ncbi:MAG: hypothetical protein NVSMB31_02370 [Vulcanimicrobiaceae bacterium]
MGSIVAVDWALYTLGTYRLTAGGTDFTAPPTQKARALLTYLVWHQGMELPRERVIEVFWPECDPERGRSSLTTALWSIRRCFRQGGIDPDTVVFANKTRISWLAQTFLDATEFEMRASAAKDLSAIRAAVDLYRGEFLENDYTDWCVAQRERLGSLYESLLSSAVLQQDDLESARLLIEREWFEERPYAIVARAELAAGRPGAAAAAIERCRRALAEVGAVPSPEFQQEFAAVTQGPAQRTARELLLPFCGRENELALLKRSLATAITNLSSIVIVRGAGGSGKSELLWQAERIANDLALKTMNVRATENDPRAFGPWATLYTQLTSRPFDAFIEGGGDATTLAHHLALALGPRSVLIVDDAQYLHGDSHEVLVHLSLDAAANNVSLLIATRPDLQRREAQLHGTLVLDLLPLSFDEIEAAVQKMAPENARPVVDFLFTRSGGHPFFARKLLESLGQSGTLRVEAGAWVFSKDAATMETPSSIRNFIQVNLFSRGEDAPLVACALALEPDATSEDLIDATALEETRALDAIDDLIALGLIDQPSHGPEFVFRHDLIKEAATRALNSGRRVRIHRAYAARFARDDRREAIVRRARHLRSSGQLLGAARALEVAAYESLRVNAWHDALAHATAGISLAKKLKPAKTHELLARLHEWAAKASEEAADSDGAMFHTDERVAHARASGDSALVSRALARRSVLYRARGMPREALTNANEALAFAQLEDDAALMMFAQLRRSLSFQSLGAGDESIANAREALTHAQASGDARLIAAAMERLMTTLAIQLHLAEALELGTLCLDLARTSDPRTEAVIRVRRAGIFYLADRFEEATEELAVVSTLFEARDPKLGIPGLYGFSTPELSFIYHAQSINLALALFDWDRAVALAAQLERATRTHAANRVDIAELFTVTALVGRNRSGDAANAYERALLLRPNAPPKGLVGMALDREVALACAAAHAGKAQAADLLRIASVRMEEQYRRSPLDTDRCFRMLADAAALVKLESFAHDMRARADELAERRLKSASPQHSTDRNSSSPVESRAGAD